MFRRNPRMWRYAYVPLAWGVGAFLIIAATVFYFFDRWARSLTDADAGPAVRLVADLGFLALLYFAGFAAYLALASLIASFGWEKLSAETELMKTGTTRPPASWSTNFADSVLRLGFTLAMSIAGLCCAVAIPGFGAAAVAGVLALLDFTATAYLRRGVMLPQQLSKALRLKSWPTFVAVSGLLSLVPIVNLLCMPLLVVAGTLMVVGSEGQDW